MGSGRTHSREFKLMVVHQIAMSEKRPAQICSENDLTESRLLRGRREYAARVEAALTPKELTGPDALQQRIAELERFFRQLALENAVPKRARQRMLAERHSLISAEHAAHRELSICRL